VTTTTVTTFDATSGAVIEQRLVEIGAPEHDVATLADQLASLTDAVDELILNELMGA